jgi:hypothetical protein
MFLRLSTRIVITGFALLSVSCLNSQPSASVSNAEPSVSNGLFTFSAVADGSIRVRPADAASSITRVDSISAAMSVNTATVTPAKTTVEIGTVEYTGFRYQLDGSRNCDWSSGMLLPRCTNPAAQVAQVDQSSSTKTDSVRDVTQAPAALTGMTCGAHYQHQTKIWQKQFRVRLAGDSGELDKIKEVRYTIHSSYGKTYVASNRADNFDAGATFLTPVTSWDVDEAIVITNSGDQITLPRGRLSWSDNDPARKAAASCE